MSSLFGALGVARQSLLAQQMGLDITQNNIANVNTPGYARQRVDLSPGDSDGGLGVQVTGIASYRSRLLDHRVNDELQYQGEFQAASEALRQVEAIFSATSGTKLPSTLAAFFNSFSSLANTPEDASLRQQVLAYGEQLSSAFKNTYDQLQAVQSLQNQVISETVAEINSIAAAIAKLNAEVQSAAGAMSNSNSLVDQRQQLIDRLASLVDISFIETESGSMTVTTRQGTQLVVGNQSIVWQTATGSDNLVRVMEGAKDITGTIQSGKLGGLLQVNGTKIVSYLAALDDMAAAVISRVNSQHALGADLNGEAGGNFFVPFVPVSGSNQGAARAMAVAITDTDKIAAGSPAAGRGSNTNATLLANIQNELLVSGNTVSGFYAALVFRIGLDSRTSIEGLDTQDSLVTQLQSQRDSTSGVSLDEEAISLMRFQKAYQATARFITVIDSLTEDIMNILS